jgi:hypothetical protein
MVACTPTSSGATLPPPMSLWGEIILLAQAEQSQSPALLIDQNRLSAAWIAADEFGVNQHVRLYTGSSLSSPLQLPLPSTRPYAQQFAAGIDGNVHLLWLDANDNSENRLYSALITPQESVERSALVSERLTLRYSSVSNTDGSLWTVWSGGFVSEPGLYIQYIDAGGRSRPSRQLTTDADWPVLIRAADGTLLLFWLQVSTGRAYRSTLIDGGLTTIELLTDGVTLQRGDRLTDLRVGLDRMSGYLFWNIARVSGQVETWFSASLLTAPAWTPPERLGVNWTTKSFFETGFNSGRAYPAQRGDRWFHLASPVSGQFDILPIAAVQGDRLVILYFQDGEVVGYQDIAQAAYLIEPPILLTDRDRHFYLAWSEPTPLGVADLKLTMTQR